MNRGCHPAPTEFYRLRSNMFQPTDFPKSSVWLRALASLFFLMISQTFINPAYGQTNPDAGALMKQYDQSQKRAPDLLEPMEKQAEKKREEKLSSGETVRVVSIRFSGAVDLVPELELHALVANAIGKDLDFTALQALADIVTDYLRSKGWFLARAYLPRQDVTAGEIEIAILAGRLSHENPVEIVSGGTGIHRINADFVKGITESAIGVGDAINEAQVDRAVLLIGDIPGVSVRARLKPGEKTDETRLELKLDEGPTLSGYGSADNFGNNSTGKSQVSVSGNINNLSGYGDQAVVMATRADGLQIERINYSVMHYTGLKISLSHTKMNYDFTTRTNQNATTALNGDSQVKSITFAYPFRRSRTGNTNLSLTLNNKQTSDFANSQIISKKSINTSQIQISGDWLDTLAGGGSTSWSYGFSDGNIDLSGLQTNYLFDKNQGYRTHGHFKKEIISLSRVQKLPGTFSLNVAINGQIAKRNLDSSEKFYLGGPNGIRAYPGSEAGGDHAVVTNLELRYDWPESTRFGNLQIQAFLDSGSIKLHDDPLGKPIDTATGRNRYSLHGMGLGFFLSQAGSHSLRATLAKKIGNNPGRTLFGNDSDGETNDYRLWLQAMIIF